MVGTVRGTQTESAKIRDEKDLRVAVEVVGRTWVAVKCHGKCAGGQQGTTSQIRLCRLSFGDSFPHSL